MIEVNDAHTEEEFVENARQAWRETSWYATQPCSAGDLIRTVDTNNRIGWIGFVDSVRLVSGEWEIRGKFVARQDSSGIIYHWRGGPRLEVVP